MSLSLFVNFCYHGVGGRENLLCIRLLQCGLFMAKLKEIARASSYGDRGLKVFSR
jgi:hypothetical protein